jgi:hypothetical protein
MRFGIATFSAALILAVAPSAYAQRVEASVLLGWTLSDGVTGDPVRALDGNLYDTVDLKDSGSWGFSFGVNATENVEVGFLFGQQLSTLAVDGTGAVDVGDLKISTYHPYLAYNVGEADAEFARTSCSVSAQPTTLASTSRAQTAKRPRPAAKRSSPAPSARA